MGNVTIQRWQCDRCGALDKSKHYRIEGQLSVFVSKEFSGEVYKTIAWSEICNPCAVEVSREIDAMKIGAENARNAAAEKRLIQL